MLKIVDVDNSLAGAQLALRAAAEGTQDALRTEVAAAIEGSWVSSLAAAAAGRQQTKLLVSGAGADVDGLSFDLIAGRGPALSGGLDASHWYAVDYGMTPKQITAPTRKKSVRGGARVPARIWVGRNLPARNAAGRVIFPTIGTQSQVYVKAWVTGLLGQFAGTPLDVDDGDELGQVSGSWQ
jgi:hypothetical protein